MAWVLGPGLSFLWTLCYWEAKYSPGNTDLKMIHSYWCLSLCSSSNKQLQQIYIVLLIVCPGIYHTIWPSQKRPLDKCATHRGRSLLHRTSNHLRARGNPGISTPMHTHTYFPGRACRFGQLASHGWILQHLISGFQKRELEFCQKAVKILSEKKIELTTSPDCMR